MPPNYLVYPYISTLHPDFEAVTLRTLDSELAFINISSSYLGRYIQLNLRKSFTISCSTNCPKITSISKLT